MIVPDEVEVNFRNVLRTMYVFIGQFNKRQRILKGKSIMNNPEKLAT